MSRGRKPKLDKGVNGWVQLFEGHVGLYLRIVCSKIGDLGLPEEATGADLLTLIRKEHPKKEQLPTLNAEEVPFRIPDDWIWCRLGDLIKHNSGKTLDGGRNSGSLRPMITTSNLYWGTFDLSTVKEVLIEDHELDRCTAQRGDLLVCEGGDAGRAAIWDSDEEMCFQNHIHRVRPLPGVNTKFIYRYFQFLAQSGEINKHRKGMGISNLSGKSLSLIPFPLPPVSVQNKITSFFDGLRDNTVRDKYFDPVVEKEIIAYQRALVKSADFLEAIKNQQSLIKQLRQAFLREAMQGKLVPQDPNDEPASELLKKIKAEKEQLIKEKKIKKEKELPPIKPDEIPFEIPKSWVWCRLEELFKFIDYRGKTPMRTSSGVRLISAKNIKFGFIDDNPIEFISETKYDSWMVRGFPRNGDILFVTEGHTMGFVAIINLDFKYVLAQRTICLQPPIYDYAKFVFFALMSPTLQNVVKKMATGSAAMGVQSAKLKKMLIPMPPLSEQYRIVTKLDQLMKYCDDLEQSIKHSQTQNEQLLQQVLREALQPKKEYKEQETLSLAAEP